MEFHVEFESRKELPLNCQELAVLVGAKVLEMEEFPFQAEVNVVVTDDEEIKEINSEYRQIDRSTDVLSFPAIPFEEPRQYDILAEEEESFFDYDTGHVMLGDIMISADHVLSQSEEYGHSIEREFAFLIAHSMLHLLGYDHMTEEDASVMEERQRTVLDALGITR